MIIFKNVSLSTFEKKSGKKTEILSSVNLRIPSNKSIALLGPSEPEKATIIKLICGTMLPSAGYVIRQARVSFPIGQVPGVEPNWSLRLNAAHVARIYGQDDQQVPEFVRRVFAKGTPFNTTYRALPPLEQKRYARILGFSIPFDTYVLLDDRLTPDCYDLFKARQLTSGMIINIQNMSFGHENCESALVMENGTLRLQKNWKKEERPRRR